MKDKYGYEIPDKTNVMHIKTAKNSNPDQEKILETANVLIDKVIEVYPDTPPQAVNILLTALNYYFVREYQNQIERHERGETPMYSSICATIMHAQRIIEGTLKLFTVQKDDVMGYLKDKPKLVNDEMSIMMKEILEFREGSSK
jgi:hypothetical protein